MNNANMLPDKNQNAVPLLSPVNGSNYQMAVTHTTAELSEPITERFIGIYTDKDCYIKFGDDTVVVTSSNYDVMIPEGAYREFKVNSDANYISALNLTAHGTLFINGLI